MSKPNLAAYSTKTEAARELRELADNIERCPASMPIYVQTNVYWLQERYYSAWCKMRDIE